MVILSSSERAEGIKKLKKEQKEALFTSISMTRKSEFASLLASHKGSERWDFHKYIDHGKRMQNVKCECGRTLRYEFVIAHRDTHITRSLGINHLQEELNIPEEIAKEIYKKIHNVNYDLDEILNKHYGGWKLNSFINSFIKSKKLVDVREDIKILLSVNLPLLDRQINWLHNQIGIIKEQTIDSFNSIPDKLSPLKTHLLQNVIPIIDNHRGARYIITKKHLNYEFLKEVNIPRVFFDDDTKFSSYRYGTDPFDLEWKYYSKTNSSGYKNRQFGPKMCIAHVEHLTDGNIGLYLIFGYKSFSSLREEAVEFAKKNNLSQHHGNSYKTYSELRNKYVDEIDFLKLHEFQIEIGKMGEAFVYDYERNKLKDTPFYNKIDRTKAENPVNGYDILSYDEVGNPLYIEVKASAKNEDSFFISNHELQIANLYKTEGKQYVIYHVKNILSSQINDITVNKIINLEKEALLEPTNWKVSIIKG
ncbi:DUF3883 domain-containing protein [Sutcliffiella horikoshii]|uniref:DUF3883 domain-containing protein n=1 Tax=Sutcliffiella horikoshii TaxID=79883 RepID=UPI003CF050DC